NSCLTNTYSQLTMFGRIDDVRSAAEDGDSRPGALQTAEVGSAVRSPSHPADDREACPGQLVAKMGGDVACVRRCSPGSDDRDRGSRQDLGLAAGPQDWRRIRDGGQQRRIPRVPERNDANA